MNSEDDIYILSRNSCESELFFRRVMVCRVLRDQYCKLILNEQSSRAEELKNVLDS